MLGVKGEGKEGRKGGREGGRRKEGRKEGREEKKLVDIDNSIVITRGKEEWGRHK